MSDQLPPEWAIERAHAAIMVYDHDSDRGVCSLSEAKERVRHLPGIRALAEYIAEHEEAPVDPLLIEGRRLLSDYWRAKGNPIEKDIADDHLLGVYDDGGDMLLVLAALRRGIELGKAF